MKYTKQTQAQTHRFKQTLSEDNEVSETVIYKIKLALFHIYNFVFKHKFSII